MARYCPICDGVMAVKTVEVEVSQGPHSKVIQVPAEVCQKCGERIYPAESEQKIKKLEEEMVSAEQEFD